MTRNEQLAILVAALVTAAPHWAEAATVTRIVTTPITYMGLGSTEFDFTPIDNADELVSISAGTATEGEGAPTTLAIAADFSSGSPTQIFSTVIPGGYNLSSVPMESFTQSTLTGLTFSFSQAFNQGFRPTLTIPTGTIFTFQTVDPVTPTPPVSGIPEPAAWAEVMAGLAALGLTMRVLRRRAPGRSAAQPRTEQPALF